MNIKYKILTVLIEFTKLKNQLELFLEKNLLQIVDSLRKFSENL